MAGQGKEGRCGIWRIVLVGAGALFLAGCDETGQLTSPFQSSVLSGDPQGQSEAPASVNLVERDVEAPDVFQVTDMGLWDGRPSLGGVWVAHPDVKEPERVIIRNNQNSNFVIGALFRRERENPGPVLQVSSDAAAALGLLAGAPAQLTVTALRREEVPDPTAEPSADLEAPKVVDESRLAPVEAIAGAAAALEEVESLDEITPAVTQATALDKPYIQIGIFSVEQNARNTAAAMRNAGMAPVVKKQTSQGKTFWRVIVGPAGSKSERANLLVKIKGVGFDDAYPVTH